MLASAGISTSTMAVLFIAYRVFLAVKGKRLVSDCCGHKGEIGMDVRDMPPSPQEENRNRPVVQTGKDEQPENLSVVVQELKEHLSVLETAQGR